MIQVRLLTAEDAERFDAFLTPHTPEAYFMRSNLRQGGMVYAGRSYQAEYFGAFDGDRLIGALSHSWTGFMQIFAPQSYTVPPLTDVLRQRLAAAPRDITGFIGVAGHVRALQAALGVTAPMLRGGGRDREYLFTLPLADMKMPDAMLPLRRAETRDMEILVPWRHDYWIEALGETPGAETLDRAGKEITRRIAEGDLFVMEERGELVSFCGAGGFLPDWKIIGPVWTPPLLRGHGYARKVTAGALKMLQEEGATHAVLFTNNEPAERAYRALGFQRGGEWALDFLIEPLQL